MECQTLLTPKLLADICDGLSEGKSLRQICRDKDLNECTVRRWLSKDDDAMTQTAHARELGCDAMADECIQIADKAELEPADRRVRIETRLKLIGKWSQRYSDKVQVQHSGHVGIGQALDALDADD